jgi:adenylate kinase family enzyme/FMN phosphatase YigB (HAD superfamily)
MRASEIQPKKLVVFDIDDTLVHTQTKVHVVKDGQIVASLNSHDFTHYKLQPGESFDFEDFRNAKEFFEKSRPIIPMMNQLKQDIATGNKVVMVTARADFDDRELFLNTFRKYDVDMSKVHVYRAGNSKQGSTEERKKAIIKTLLDNGNYTKAIMYDDAKPNLHTFIELKKDHPQTKFYAWHVSLQGDASEYMREEIIDERKKRKKKSKSRWAAYGPGPYGLYGVNTGYSGDGGVSGDGGGGGESANRGMAESVNDPHTFKCIFLFGPMGAGKSTVARPLLTHTGLRSVNLDNFNELFVKKGQVPTGHLSPDQLEKSWELTQKQQQNFIDGRLGVIIDGSGRNPSTAIGVIEKLAPMGYEFMMIFVNVSEATSIARQQSRAEKQKQQWGAGRQVDPELAKNTYAQVQKNLDKYSAYFGPQRFVYVDNENTPDLTQATKKVEAFLRAPVRQPEALAWIQSQKGGDKVAQQQKKLATAQDRQQQARKQFNPLNPKFAKKGMEENFADGENPGRKGLSKRVGIPKKASLGQLEKIAGSSTGERRRMAQWQLNMRRGQKK